MPEVQEGESLEALAAAISARQEDIIRLASQAGNWDVIPGSEPSRAFRRRILDSIDEIVGQNIGKRVLVFAHGGSINAYASEVLGLEKDFFFPCANTSITVVRASNQRRVLYTLNDVAHLKL
jgi:broad specificity phosphatase PhoE